jgi:pilus assembly protein CpaC
MPLAIITGGSSRWLYIKLVLSGDSQTVERAMNVAAGLAPAGVVNAPKVTTPQQVMLKVRFVEADRAATPQSRHTLSFLQTKRQLGWRRRNPAE